MVQPVTMRVEPDHGEVLPVGVPVVVPLVRGPVPACRSGGVRQ